MQRAVLTIVLLAVFAAAVPARGDEVKKAAPCNCAELLDALVARVETNYPGYHLEVKNAPREEAYIRHRSTMRLEAEAGDVGLECLRVLQTYVAWFEDGHLFVGGRSRPESPEDAARQREAAPRVDWTETDVHRYLDQRPSALDPVEGLWLDPAGLKLAIVRHDMDSEASEASANPGRFVGFVLTSSIEGWTPGDVKADFTALADRSYDVILYDDARAATRPHVYKRGQAGGARLQRDGLLLHMPPTTWGKVHPVRPGQEGLIDPLDPRAPTARRLNDGTVVFHVPSHIPGHAARLRALVEQYRGALGRAETLIIDLRGNEGGSTFVTNVLMPFLVTPEKRTASYLAGGQSAVLASPDNVAYFRRTSWAPEGLVARLEAANPGTVVPFADPVPDDQSSGEEIKPGADVAVGYPRNVAILTDAMTVSAAEAFVLKAMRNHKVTLFGEATGGSIDYQNVGIVGFGCPEAGLHVGYPTIIGSDRLPKGGVRPSGIVPDVPLDSRGGDPIQQIIEHYSRKRGR